LASLIADLDQLGNQSQAVLQHQKQYNPLCKQHSECVGWGVDGSSGSLASFPVIQLSYSDPAKTYQHFREPVEAQVNPHLNPVFAFDTHTFPTVGDFTDYVNTAFIGSSPSGGSNGIYGQSFPEVFNTYYQPMDDRALSVSSALYTTVDLTLPSDPVTHQYQFTLDSFAHKALRSLPPAYNTTNNKAIFRAFVKKYGTSVVIEASMGGLVEEYSRWKTAFFDNQAITKEWLVKNAEVDFTQTTGLGGHTGTVDPAYQQARLLSPVACVGGDVSKCFNAQWKASVAQAPALLRYKVLPIAEMLGAEDQDIKKSVVSRLPIGPDPYKY
jgi:hypothetical protein